MAWTIPAGPDPKQQRATDKRIMLNTIREDATGRKLTPEAQEKAADFAVDTWKGSTTQGDAARTGIHHVTKDILK